MKSDDAFRFSHFLVPSQQRNHRKYFYCHGKYFAKENFRAPAWTSAKFYCENKTGNPKRAVSLHLVLSSSQSKHRIRCILSTHGACCILNIIIMTSSVSGQDEPNPALSREAEENLI